jgi:hypothetical protein
MGRAVTRLHVFAGGRTQRPVSIVFGVVPHDRQHRLLGVEEGIENSWIELRATPFLEDCETLLVR